MGSGILGNYIHYFRKVFWDSMDSRSVTKVKRGDLIDSLLALKAENKPDDIFREYIVNIRESIFFPKPYHPVIRSSDLLNAFLDLFTLVRKEEGDIII